MPILKIPIVHKFGIISHSQRLELQERLLKEAYEKLSKNDAQEAEQTKNTLEISEDFIKRFNGSVGSVNQDIFEDLANKHLLRVKRKVGLSTGNAANNINVPFGWTELTLLAQCKGTIHEKSLDVLILSLEQAPLSKHEISSLFYLAETVLYWLQTEEIGALSVKTSAYKILKIGKIVFLRLYFHNMSGNLQSEIESKSRLVIYLEEFSRVESEFQAYSDALLNFRYICAIGKILTNEVEQENNNLPQETSDRSGYVYQDTDNEVNTDIQNESKTSKTKISVASEVHQLSPSLFHALDVWRCACGQGGGLKDALEALWTCCRDIREESWVDVVVAMLVLSEAAKSNLLCLQLFQVILEDILLNWTPSEDLIETSPSDGGSKSSSVASNQIAIDGLTSKDDITTATETSFRQFPDDSGANPALSPIPETHSRGITHRASSAASSQGRTSPLENNATRWTWHVCVACIEHLCNVALQGTTSQIRQVALTSDSQTCLVELAKFKGNSQEGSEAWSWHIRYAALQSLVQISEGVTGNPEKEAMKNAVVDTMRTLKTKERDPRVLKAFKIGHVNGSLEKELTHTLKGKSPNCIGSEISKSLANLYLPPLPPPIPLNSTPRTTNQKSRTGNAAVSSVPTGRRAAPPSGWNVPSKRDKEDAYKKISSRYRIPLKQEVELAKSYDLKPAPLNERQDFCLFRVVEDQWRKDLHMQMELEEENRNKELLAKQEESALTNLAKIQSYKERRDNKMKNAQSSL